MTVRTLLALNALLAGISGVALLAVPAQYVAPFGVTLDAPGTLFAQLYGNTLLGLAATCWMARQAGAPARRAVVAGAGVTWGIFTALMALAMAGAVVSSTVIVWIVVGALFTAAFGGALAGVGVREEAFA